MMMPILLVTCRSTTRIATAGGAPKNQGVASKVLFCARLYATCAKLAACKSLAPIGALLPRVNDFPRTHWRGRVFRSYRAVTRI